MISFSAQKVDIFLYIFLETQGEYQFLSVTRGCERLEHEDDRTVDTDACYDFKDPEDSRRLNNQDNYQNSDNYQISEMRTCSTDNCNSENGYTFRLCDESGVGFLESRTSGSKSLCPISSALTMGFAFCLRVLWPNRPYHIFIFCVYKMFFF